MQKNYSKPLIVIVVLVVLAVVVLWVGHHKASAPASAPKTTASSADNSASTPPVPQLQTSGIDNSQLPPGLPTNLPQENGAQVLQNRLTTNATTGQQEAFRMYVTKNTLAQNLALYQKYLSDNGWKVTSTVNQPEFQVINASKGTAKFSIILDYKSAAPQDQVSLDYKY